MEPFGRARNGSVQATEGGLLRAVHHTYRSACQNPKIRVQIHPMWVAGFDSTGDGACAAERVRSERRTSWRAAGKLPMGRTKLRIPPTVRGLIEGVAASYSGDSKPLELWWQVGRPALLEAIRAVSQVKVAEDVVAGVCYAAVSQVLSRECVRNELAWIATVSSRLLRLESSRRLRMNRLDDDYATTSPEVPVLIQDELISAVIREIRAHHVTDDETAILASRLLIFRGISVQRASRIIASQRSRAGRPITRGTADWICRSVRASAFQHIQRHCGLELSKKT